MNFFTKKVSLIWVILVPILTFILGPGFVWELRKTNIESGRLTLETARTSLELREKINKMMSEIIATDPRSPLWKLAVDNLNATEKGLAGIEGRPPITYEFKLPNPAGDLKVS
ncbi:MAG TPA: hypothetical protein VGK65_02635 [Candidatus Binatia bacterium]|jgi:hypothetical protein